MALTLGAALYNALQGANHDGYDITWTRDDTTPEDLTSATITAKIQAYVGGTTTGSPTSSTGTFTVTGAPGGNFHWAPSLTDVATAGTYVVQFIATYGDATVAKTYPAPWTVVQSL
jgi:hypothetical protein